jgi:hypothetical protein
MVLAHIFGIPVEETAITFAPVMFALIVGLRLSGRWLHRSLRASAGRLLRGKHT